MGKHAYIGRKACGCVVAVTMIKPDRLMDVAKNVQEWIEHGLTIERVASERVPELWSGGCTHEPMQWELFAD